MPMPSNTLSELLHGEDDSFKLSWVCPGCGKMHGEVSDAVKCAFGHDSRSKGHPSGDSAAERIGKDIYEGYLNGKQGKFAPVPVVITTADGESTMLENPVELHRYLRLATKSHLPVAGAAWAVFRFAMFILVTWGVTNMVFATRSVGAFAVVACLLVVYIVVYTSGKKAGEVMLVPLSHVDAGVILAVNGILLAVLPKAGR